MVGNGLLLTLFGVRATQAGFSALVVGAVLAAYHVGFLAGSRVTPGLLRRIGSRRSFCVLAGVVAVVAVFPPVAVVPWFWVSLRLGQGFCVAGLYVVIESWLNASATNANRGRVLGSYVAVMMAGFATGALLYRATGVGGAGPFLVASGVTLVALVPVWLAGDRTPGRGAGRAHRLPRPGGRGPARDGRRLRHRGRQLRAPRRGRRVRHAQRLRHRAHRPVRRPRLGRRARPAGPAGPAGRPPSSASRPVRGHDDGLGRRRDARVRPVRRPAAHGRDAVARRAVVLAVLDRAGRGERPPRAPPHGQRRRPPGGAERVGRRGRPAARGGGVPRRRQPGLLLGAERGPRRDGPGRRDRRLGGPPGRGSTGRRGRAWSRERRPRPGALADDRRVRPRARQPVLVGRGRGRRHRRGRAVRLDGADRAGRPRPRAPAGRRAQAREVPRAPRLPSGRPRRRHRLGGGQRRPPPRRGGRARLPPGRRRRPRRQRAAASCAPRPTRPAGRRRRERRPVGRAGGRHPARPRRPVRPG